MQVDVPTVTAIRVQATMTGALSSYIDMKDNFQSEMVQEDSILH